MNFESDSTDYPIPSSATHVVLFAAAGDTGGATAHASDPVPLSGYTDQITGQVKTGALLDEAREHMWATVAPDSWFVFTDADGNPARRKAEEA